MSEELNLVRDLAVIFIAAGSFTIISKALKQPLILGYIIAGFLIGPHIDFFPGISSVEEVDQWSEIGIIFLMFTLGLEFSFKKLLKVGSSALITAGCKFLGVFVIGFVIGQALDWTTMESVFLAGLLSMSSTAVVIKAYDDMNLKDRSYAGQVFGTLVVEDLIAILLMVLLSTMAVSNKFAGGEMLFNLGKLAFFLILWFLIGIYVIPTILQKARKYINDEILLIVSIGLCFSMVTLANAVGFSSALGAFVMGSILAETVESEHISKLVSGIKDLFSAIFFVSVGMMVNPEVILEHWAVILVLTITVYLTHIFFSAAGGILSGKSLKDSIHTGFSLAQLGEFGFIIAGVGVGLGVMRDFIYPVIIAVSVITTFTTPYLIKAAGPSYEFTRKRLPQRWLEWLDNSKTAPQSKDEQNLWKKLIQAYSIRIVLYSVILIAVLIGSKLYIDPLVGKIPSEIPDLVRNIISAAITFVVMLPFLYGLAVNTDTNAYARQLISNKEGNLWPLMGLIFLRIFIAIGFVLVMLSNHFDLAGWASVAVLLAGFIFFLLARKSMHKFSVIEKRFLSNLNEKDAEEKKRKPVSTSVSDKLAGYDVSIRAVTVSPESSFAGKRIMDLPIRSETGVNLILIERGSRKICIPDANETIYPHDRILAVGTSEQLEKFKAMVKESVPAGKTPAKINFDVIPAILSEESYLTGKTLRECNLREYRCMVISVLSGDDFITNPAPDFRFSAGDRVWVAGDTSVFLEIGLVDVLTETHA